MRPLARIAPPKKGAGKKDSSAASAIGSPSEGARRLELLRASLKQLHQAVLAALESLDRGMASWLATPQKQQARACPHVPNSVPPSAGTPLALCAQRSQEAPIEYRMM